jgi:epoxyqueuosine reductase
LAEFINSIAAEPFQFKICVDSAPLSERALAARAGLGFIGKNHILINPAIGPQLLLGEIITTLKLPVDQPIADTCSNCNNCIKACPTGALTADGRFDANKCISYLTIEYKGRIPNDLAEKIGDRLFGCDQCVLACPFHKKAPPCQNKYFTFYPDRAKLNLHEILALTEDSFGTKFADSPLKRLPLDCLKRNAKICLANVTQQAAAQPAD